MSKFNWNETTVATLTSIAGDIGGTVSKDAVLQAAETLDTTANSVAAKLRHMGYTVASLAVSKAPAFTEDEGQALADFVNNNAGVFTYAEIAENFMGGKFTAKQVQGKLLALELTGNVKKAEPKEVVRTYTDAEEAQVIAAVEAGKFLEEIAEVVGKSINSVRGKCLSLLRKGQISSYPKQRDHKEPSVKDVFADLDIASMTVEQIAESLDKTTTGIKSMLTKRGIACANYDGAAKKAKAEAKKAEAA